MFFQGDKTFLTGFYWYSWMQQDGNFFRSAAMQNKYTQGYDICMDRKTFLVKLMSTKKMIMKEAFAFLKCNKAFSLIEMELAPQP